MAGNCAECLFVWNLELKYLSASCRGSGRFCGVEPNISHHLRNHEGICPLKFLAILLQLTHFRMLKILTMVTTWTAIMNLDAPETAPESSKVHLCISSATIQNSTRVCKVGQLLFTAQYKNTMQNYYSRKARGQYTVHKQ